MRTITHTSLRALLGLTAAVALTALPAPFTFAAGPANSKDIPKVAGKLQTTPPPAGAEVLFDGSEKSLAENWVPGNSKAKLWPIKDGVLIDSNTDILTKKAYGSCKIHLEWRVPADRKVDGQKGANSGVIFHGVKRDKKSKSGWYEVQILESHSNPGTYADGIAGAIYLHSAPKVNPALPQGEWQSYDITFTAPKFSEGKDAKVVSFPRFTVVYNGVTVQDDYELKSTTYTRGDGNESNFKPHPVKQPITLQWHKDPIEFRNIWIVDLEK